MIKMKTKKELISDYNMGLIEEVARIEGVYHCIARVIHYDFNNEKLFGYFQFSGQPKTFFHVKLYFSGTEDTHFYINKSKFYLTDCIRINSAWY
jgi:hypothetical protein